MSDNIKFLADALAYHTKGRKAFMESKCSCCGHDPCDCPADCDCKQDVKEASTVNGVDQEGKKRWKTTGLSHSDAIEKHGKDNVKVTKGGLRNGDDHVQVYSESNDGYYAYQDAKDKYHKDNPGSDFDRAPEHHKQKYIHPEMQKRGYTKQNGRWIKEGADEVNDKNINAVHDKDEGEATDNTVKMTNDIIAGKQPYKKPIKSIFEPAKKTSVDEETDVMTEEEVLDMLEEFVEMFDELGDLLEDYGMDIIEGFEAISEDFDEDPLEEDFSKMSKTKQLIARRRAGRKKKLTPGYKLKKNPQAKKPQFGK